MQRRENFFRDSEDLECWNQRDLMDRLLVQFLTFTAMKNCQTAYKNYQSNLKMLPNTKWTISKCPKFFNITPKWWNFAKSGHTGWNRERERAFWRSWRKREQESVAKPTTILFWSVVRESQTNKCQPQSDGLKVSQDIHTAIDIVFFTMTNPGRQDFRLTWVNYSQKLTESFHKFLTSEILCNVTLWVHNKSSSNCIKAHQGSIR